MQHDAKGEFTMNPRSKKDNETHNFFYHTPPVTRFQRRPRSINRQLAKASDSKGITKPLETHSRCDNNNFRLTR
jgi:hypothetical protein